MAGWTVHCFVEANIQSHCSKVHCFVEANIQPHCSKVHCFVEVNVHKLLYLCYCSAATSLRLIYIFEKLILTFSLRVTGHLVSVKCNILQMV